jgi:prophage antirepressor-like protein
MNQVVPFQFELQEVRVVMIGDAPWFVAKDVVEAVGALWNGSATIKHIPEEWRGVTSDVTPLLTLSEQGVYFYLIRSDKPKALPIQRWLANDVMPSIRKTGSYSIQKPEKLPTNFDAIRALVDAAEAHETRLKKVEGAIENLGAHEDFKSIKAYAAIVGRKITTKESGDLGRAATAVSKQDGYKIGKQPDESFGFVNTYHRDVLARVFAIDT